MHGITRTELSECELVAMKCIWDMDGAAPCKDVMDRMREAYGMDYKITTVYTLLTKLAEKGFVRQERMSGKVSFYEAECSQEEYMFRELEMIKDFWFSGSTAAFIKSLVTELEMTGPEKEEVASILRKQV